MIKFHLSLKMIKTMMLIKIKAPKLIHAISFDISLNESGDETIPIKKNK
jgi:hypothetical protein